MNRYFFIIQLTSLFLLSFNIYFPTAEANFAGSEEAGRTADRNAVLSWMIGDYPKTLNPMLATLASEFDASSPVFDGLMTTDPDTGEINCVFCTGYEYSRDKKSLTMTLRKDAKFHDLKPVTVDDVVFSFQVMMHPKVDNLLQKSNYLASIERVEKVDDEKLKIVFKDTKFMNIYRASVPLLPKHRFGYFEKNPENFNRDHEFSRAPIGSGPYRFKKWTGNKTIELERFDEWWGFSDPRFKNSYNFKTIRFKVVTDDNISLQAFKKGEFDYMALQSYQFKELLSESKTNSQLRVLPFHFEVKIGTSFMYIGWNGRLPMFSDVDTRHALALLTDRFSTLDKFSMGLRPPTNGPWGIRSPDQCPESQCPVVEFDPEEAKKLLKRAGWTDSDGDGVLDRTRNGEKQKLSFTILAQQGDYSKNVLGVYSAEMKKAGVEAKIKQLEFSSLHKLVDDLKFEALFSGFRAGYPESPRQLWHSENTAKGGSNAWNFVDKEVDQWINQFEKEFDSKNRRAIAQKIHRRIYESHSVLFHHEGGGCLLGRNKNLLGVEVAYFQPDCVYWPKWYKK